MYLTPHFSVYRIDESVEFIQDINAVFKEGYSETLSVKTQHDAFRTELEKLKDVYKKSRKSVLTLKIEETDEKRDKGINGITAIARAYLYHHDP